MKAIFKKHKLEELCEIQIGKTPKREIDFYWGNGYPWVAISDMKGPLLFETKEQITERAVKESGCKLIRKGTLLMSFKLSIGKLAFAGLDLYTNEAIAALTLKQSASVHLEYLYYVLKVIPLVGANVAAKGSTLNKESLKRLEIPLPETLDDQIKIARILSKTEALIQQRKDSINLLDEFLKSTFLEMFGDPTTNEKGFEFTSLEKLCKIIVDCPHSTPVKAENITNFPCIRTSELTKGYISWDSMQYLDEPEYIKRTQRLQPEEGDIVYGREGSYGDAIRIPGGYRFSLGQRTMLFRPDYEKTNSIFLWAMVRSEFVYRQAKKKNNSSTVGHVNVKDIKQFTVINPPLELQNSFAEIVTKAETLKSHFLKSLNELENLYGSLSQLAFKGELDLTKIALLYDEEYSSTDNDRTEPKPIDWTRVSIQAKDLSSSEIEDKRYGDPFEGIEGLPDDGSLFGAEELKKLMDTGNWEDITDKDMEEVFPKETPLTLSSRRFASELERNITIDVQREELAWFIRDKFHSAHFDSAMLVDMLEANGKIVHYFTSEELKFEKKTEGRLDLKEFIFDCLRGANHHLHLEQFFHNAYENRAELIIINRFTQKYAEMDSAEQTGIYFKILP
jgi:type I restriction enzyme, S subunit